MLGGLSPAGVNVGLRAVRVVEARLVVRVSGRVGDSEVRVAADEAEAVDLGGTASEILSVFQNVCALAKSQPVGTTRRGENQLEEANLKSSRADSVSVPSSPSL